MPLEIERKFLVRKDLWYALHKPEGEDIIQGYLVSEPSLTIRVRVKNSSSFLTIKGPVHTATRMEYEYQIPKTDAVELLKAFAKNTIEKTRYRIGFEGKTWEVDEFFGDNEGLIIAEIELESEDETFVHPLWLGEEVTEDKKYFNSALAVHPYKSW
jgi:adenylate cyclase